MQKYLKTVWRLWLLLKPFHKDFYIQLFFIIVVQLISVSLIYITSKLLDSLVSKDFILSFQIALFFFAFRFFTVFFDYFSEVHGFKRLEMSIQQYLQEYSLNKIFRLNPSQYQEDHSAVKLQVISRGESAIETIISKILLELLPVLTQILFSLVAIFIYSKSIALIVLLSLLIVLFWSYRFAEYHRPFVKQNMDNWDVFQKVRTESFQHLYLIKILSSVNKFKNKYLLNRKKILDYSIFTWMKALNHALKRRLFFVVSRNISTFVLIYLAYLQTITIGGIYAVWQYINNVYDQVQTITRNIRQLPLHFIELDKYLSVIDKEPDFSEMGIHNFEREGGDIVFQNLSFKYPAGDSNVLHDINMKISSGEKVAFVGHSGSGKTTLTKILLRSYDYTSGSILLGGKELKDIDADSLRENIGYVEQHVDLFDDTVKNNILLSVKAETLTEWEKSGLIEEKLEGVAKLARIDEFYHRLGEKKFETEIGERGIKLSGGERQRIGIARAIIKEPAILIFDEATSALDAVNEKYIKEAIDNVSQGRTTLIIAHRLSTVVGCDCIYVLDKGRIVASGTHKELLERSSEYQELIKNQNLHQ